jgi:hypothetical protein
LPRKNDQTPYKTTYRISELRPGYYQIDIVKPDKSKHLIAGFKTREEAEAWVIVQERKGASGGDNLPPSS